MRIRTQLSTHLKVAADQQQIGLLAFYAVRFEYGTVYLIGYVTLKLS
jgi:hypothetical protein